MTYSVVFSKEGSGITEVIWLSENTWSVNCNELNLFSGKSIIDTRELAEKINRIGLCWEDLMEPRTICTFPLFSEGIDAINEPGYSELFRIVYEVDIEYADEIDNDGCPEFYMTEEEQEIFDEFQDWENALMLENFIKSHM